MARSGKRAIGGGSSSMDLPSRRGPPLAVRGLDRGAASRGQRSAVSVAVGRRAEGGRSIRAERSKAKSRARPRPRLVVGSTERASERKSDRTGCKRSWPQGGAKA